MSIILKDIKTFVPMNTAQEFCLDTNVLYWYAYPRYVLQEKPGNKIRAQYYYDFVDRLVSNGNPLVTTQYNISELINIIEKHEYEIFCVSHSETPYSRKDFRKIPEQRANLKRILKATLSNVNAICTTLDFDFKGEILENCVETLDQHRCDVFDFMILSYYKESSHTNIITDDDDFTSVDGIHIYTANETSLSSMQVHFN